MINMRLLKGSLISLSFLCFLLLLSSCTGPSNTTTLSPTTTPSIQETTSIPTSGTTSPTPETTVTTTSITPSPTTEPTTTTNPTPPTTTYPFRTNEIPPFPVLVSDLYLAGNIGIPFNELALQQDELIDGIQLVQGEELNTLGLYWTMEYLRETEDVSDYFKEIYLSYFQTRR